MSWFRFCLVPPSLPRLLPGTLLMLTVLALSGCAGLGDHAPEEETGEEEAAAAAEGMTEAPRRATLPAYLGPEVVRGKQGAIAFEGTEWKLTQAQRRQAAEVATYLKVHGERVILAGGAASGHAEYSRQLGQQRALAVKEALIRAGIPASRITTVSFGENLPGKGRDRVEFGLVPTGEKPAGTEG